MLFDLFDFADQLPALVAALVRRRAAMAKEA
jgi:hypothetical protein